MKNFVCQVLFITGKYDSTWQKHQEIHFKTQLERKSEENKSWSINFFASKGLDPTNVFFSSDYTLRCETLGDRSHDVNRHITCPLWLNRLVVSHPKSLVIYFLSDTANEKTKRSPCDTEACIVSRQVRFARNLAN